MTDGFGLRLMVRAKALAGHAVDQAGAAMIAAAEAELPQGVEPGREPEGIVLTGRGIRARYWGNAGRVPDVALRLFLGRLMERRSG